MFEHHDTDILTRELHVRAAEPDEDCGWCETVLGTDEIVYDDATDRYRHRTCQQEIGEHHQAAGAADW